MGWMVLVAVFVSASWDVEMQTGRPVYVVTLPKGSNLSKGGFEKHGNSGFHVWYVKSGGNDPCTLNSSGTVVCDASLQNITGVGTAGQATNTVYLDGTKYAQSDAGFSSALTEAGAKGTVVIPANSSVSLTGSHTISTNYTTIRCEPGGVLSYAASVSLNLTGTHNRLEDCELTGPGTGTATSPPVIVEGTKNSIVRNHISGFGSTSGNGNVLVRAGSGHEISDNWIFGNVSTGIFVNTVTALQTISNIRVMRNHVDCTSCTGADAVPVGITLHTTAALSSLSDVVVGDNVVLGQTDLCYETGAFGGNTPTNVVMSNNVCKLVGNANGGYSIGINHFVASGNTFDSQGYTISVGAYEVALANDGTVAGNMAYVGTAGSGYICDRCNRVAWSGNTVNGFSTAGTGFGFHIVVASTTSPSANNNTFTGNVVNFPRGGAGKGFWVQCNATGANCNNNSFIGNTVASDGTSGSQAFYLEDDRGTLSNTLINNNVINAPATGVLVGSGASGTVIGRQLTKSATAITDKGTNTEVETHCTKITTATLSSGSTTVTLSGNDVFSSASSYIAHGTDQTTPSNAVSFTYTSGTQFIITGTGTDVIRYRACGY